MQRGIIAFGVVVSVAAAVTVGLIASGAGGDPAVPGGPIGDRVPGASDGAQARRTTDALAAIGTPIASGDGVIVESVASARSAGIASTDAVRLTMQRGPFQVRDMPIVVKVDGQVVGRARPSPDLSSAATVTSDRSWLHVGAQVTWSYGDLGASAIAGTITALNP